MYLSAAMEGRELTNIEID
jgi:hypothetical protein